VSSLRIEIDCLYTSIQESTSGESRPRSPRRWWAIGESHDTRRSATRVTANRMRLLMNDLKLITIAALSSTFSRTLRKKKKRGKRKKKEEPPTLAGMSSFVVAGTGKA